MTINMITKSHKHEHRINKHILYVFSDFLPSYQVILDDALYLLFDSILAIAFVLSLAYSPSVYLFSLVILIIRFFLRLVCFNSSELALELV